MAEVIQAGYDTLRVDGIDGVVHIESLEIRQKVNEHAKLKMCLMLEYEAAQAYIEDSMLHRSIRLQMINGQVLFYGIMTDSELETRGGVSYLNVTAGSFTMMLDWERKNRSWQNSERMRETVLAEILAEYPNSTMLWNEPEGKAAVGQFLLQYQETDWEFCKRVGSLSNAGLFPEVRLYGPKFCVGLPLVQKEKILKNTPFRFRQNIGKILRTQLGEEDSPEYEVKGVADLYILGDQVNFRGASFIVAQIYSYLSKESGILLHDYLLVTKGGTRQERIYNERLKGKSVSGTAIDVARGYTRLHLHMDANQEAAEGEWFVQPAFYTGSGGYCAMPERGDVLSLHFPTEDETDCYIISAQGASSDTLFAGISSAAAGAPTSTGGSGSKNGSGTGGSSGAEVTDANMNRNKAWTTPGGRGMLLNDGQIKFHGSGGSTQLTLSDGDGILAVSTGAIDISGKTIGFKGSGGAAQKIGIESAKEIVLLSGGSSILMESGSGEVHMYADELHLESPRNAPKPDLPDLDEVAQILAGYEADKKSFLSKNLLYYLDPSGYTRTDIDQARQTWYFCLIDAGKKQLNSLNNYIEGWNTAFYIVDSHKMDLFLIIRGESVRSQEMDDEYVESVMASLGKDLDLESFKGGYIDGEFAKIMINSAAAAALLVSAGGVKIYKTISKGATLAPAFAGAEFGGSASAIATAYEVEVSSSAVIALALAAVGLGGGSEASGSESKTDAEKERDKLLEGAQDTTTNKSGKTKNYEKQGGDGKAQEDYNNMDLKDEKEINTPYGKGKMGYDSDGNKVIYRPGSKTGGSTIEIQLPGNRAIKIRY